jgi:hypothetical protein
MQKIGATLFFMFEQEETERTEIALFCLLWCLLFKIGFGGIKTVNRPQSEAELAALRKCIERGTPYGNELWQHATAERLGLEASLHPRGRPRTTEKK